MLENLSPEARAALEAAAGETRLRAGEPLFGDGENHGIALVLSGRLEAVEQPPLSGVVRIISPGEAVDELQALAGVRNSLVIRATEDSVLLVVDNDDVDTISDKFADVRAALERQHRRQLLSRLYTVLGTFDKEFLDAVENMADWVHLSRGELLYEQNNPVDGIYLVVSGRMRTSSIDRSGNPCVIGESCRGEVVGELAFFGAERREERVQAVRESVLVGVTREEFDALVTRRPEILRHVTRALVERMHRPPALGAAVGGVTNIALVPITSGVATTEFTKRLVNALSVLGRTLYLTSVGVEWMMGEPGISVAWGDTDEQARLLAWLDGREMRHRFVIYQADDTATLWTRRCIRQADRVILIADASGNPELSETETALRELEGASDDASRTLVLIHPEETKLPSGTRRWLEKREVREHYHIRIDRDSDFSRLARALAGRSKGLVLGGGGARGFAHIGILKALEENEIPVDMIAGTSMGAAVAAQYAMGWTADELAKMFRKVYVDIKPQNDYTLPLLSLVGTRKAEMCGVMIFGETDIEDLWIPFFCISSNLTTAQMVVHRRGLLRKAQLASASLPGFVPPVLEGNQLLVDGGLLNNVPTDVMREIGCGMVMASEVSVEEDAMFTCERVPSTWELVRRKFRNKKKESFPSLIELAVRASLLHSTSVQTKAIEDADFSFRPPIDQFGMIDFLRIDDIVALGYDYGTKVIPSWKKETREFGVPM